MTNADKAQLARRYNVALGDVINGTARTEFDAGRALGELEGLERGMEACGYAFRKDEQGYAMGVDRIKED